MRRSLWKAFGLGLFVALVAPGCGKGDDDDDSGSNGTSALTPTQVCGDVGYEQCKRIYECASPDQLRSLGFRGDQIQCGSDAIDKLGCLSATQSKVCAGSGQVTAADAAACKEQVKAANCSDVATKEVSSYAPKCGQCAL